MSIRTTVTLDEDVYERLKEESRRRGVPFRQTLKRWFGEDLPLPENRSAGHASW